VRSRLFVGEAFRSITSNLSTTVAATMTVLIGMFLLGLFIALGSWVVSWSNDVKQEVLVEVYFTTEPDVSVKRQDANALAQRIGQMPEVEQVTVVPPDVGLEEMREQFPDLVDQLSSNPLPWAIEVKPRNAEDAELIANRLEPLPPKVDKVDFGKETTDKILGTARIIEIAFLVAAVILLIASTILIANTIRLSIFSRRREIEVMKLVGATNWFVRGPFMLEGLICGLIGSILAVVLLFLGKELALPELLSDTVKDAGDDVQAWAFPAVAGILVALGLALGALGSGITLRRFLRI
jgi:cell division transport system permease protein